MNYFSPEGPWVVHPLRLASSISAFSITSQKRPLMETSQKVNSGERGCGFFFFGFSLSAEITPNPPFLNGRLFPGPNTDLSPFILHSP